MIDFLWLNVNFSLVFWHLSVTTGRLCVRWEPKRNKLFSPLRIEVSLASLFQGHLWFCFSNISMCSFSLHSWDTWYLGGVLKGSEKFISVQQTMESRQFPAHSRSQSSFFVTWKKWAGSHGRPMVIRNFVQVTSRLWWSLVGHQLVLAMPAGVAEHSCALCRSPAAFPGICCSYNTLWNSGVEGEASCVVVSKCKMSL